MNFERMFQEIERLIQKMMNNCFEFFGIGLNISQLFGKTQNSLKMTSFQKSDFDDK